MREDYRDFRIDRIRKISTTNKCFKLRNRKSLKEYLDEQYKDVELKKIVIRLPKSSAKNMLNSKYYYGFVNEITKDDISELTFMYNELEYFARWILSYTSGVEIVEPLELKEEIIKLVNELNQHYLS